MNSRERFSFVILLVLPLLVYGLAVWQVFGAPEDFARLALGGQAEGVSIDHAHGGLIHGALLETAFLHVDTVANLVWVRLLTVVLAMLAGLAVWQLLERGGWAEFDAAAAGALITLLPSVQLMAGWATSWPALLAALLSLAGFAAVESELERGGLKRAVGVLGGVVLYFSASLVHFPSAIFGVVPLAGVLLVRPTRFWADHGKWLWQHGAILAAGLVGGWVFERWLLEDAGLLASIRGHDLGSRVGGLLLAGLPQGLSAFLPYWLLPGGPWVAWVGALVVLGLIWAAMKREQQENEAATQKWSRALLLPLAFVLLTVFLAQDWRPGLRMLLPLGGVMTVATVAALRVLVAPGKKTLTVYYVGLGLLVAVIAALAGVNARSAVAEPLVAEWAKVRAAVMRAHLPERSRIFVVSDTKPWDRPATFEASALAQPGVPALMVRAALHERFGASSGKRTILVESAPAPKPGVAYDLVINPAALP